VNERHSVQYNGFDKIKFCAESKFTRQKLDSIKLHDVYPLCCVWQAPWRLQDVLPFGWRYLYPQLWILIGSHYKRFPYWPTVRQSYTEHVIVYCNQFQTLCIRFTWILWVRHNTTPWRHVGERMYRSTYCWLRISILMYFLIILSECCWVN
jgi:hypothetical protein